MNPVVDKYERGLWWSMDLLGVSDSVKWKIFVAVGIQFGVSVAQAILPAVTSGVDQLLVSGLLFAGAIVAFGNTILITQDDIIDPLRKLDTAARAISRGDLDVDHPNTSQSDEIGRLIDSFARMNNYLRTVERRAEALANHEFDSEVMDKEIPGTFGDFLERSTESLQTHIEQIESDRDRFRLLNYLVGHDIPNLLNIVLGRGELLKSEVETASQRKHVELILKNANEIVEITETVHQLTHSNALEEVDLSEVLRKELERVDSTYADAEVKEVGNVPSSPYVLGNNLLYSLFGNLISNAIEHNDSPTPTVEVSVESNGDWWIIRVADDGPGIPKGKRDRLFDGVDPGSGLGLVKTVTDRFGGEMWIEGNDSGGTTFVVSLPSYSLAKSRLEASDQIDALHGND